MIIKNITLTNYRLYKGVNMISFNPKEGRNIYLISGENGFGKTTFLHSLIWCLYGRLIADIEETVRKDILNNGYTALQKSNLNNAVRQELQSVSPLKLEEIRKRGYQHDTMYIRELSRYAVSIEFAEVVIPSIPCSSLRVTRSYDIVTEKEDVEILIDGAKNELTKEIGPDVFINDFVLNKDIARFFFFDSEQIVSLAETYTPADKRKLCSAYNEVLGVRKYEDLKRNLENMRVRFRKKSSDLENRDKLSALLDAKDKLGRDIEEMNNQSVELSSTLVRLRAKNEALQLQMLREGNEVTMEALRKCQEVVDKAKGDDELYKKKLKEYLEYAPFAIVGSLLSQTKTQLDEDRRIRRSNSDAESRNSVIDSITEDLLDMLSSGSLHEDQKAELQVAIQDILRKHRSEAMNSDPLINASEEDYREFTSVFNNVTSTYRIEFEHLAEAYKKNKLILDRNIRKIGLMQSKENDELIKKIREEKNAIEGEIRETEELVKSLHEHIGTKTQELASTNKRISELSKKVSLDDSDEQKDELAGQLVEELNVFLTSLKNEKKYALERRIRNIMNTLMHKEDFIGRVEVNINNDDMDIDLYSGDGTKINKDALSKGEQQLYATTILKSLVDESGIHFPVFIDSPLQKFDKSHSNKIITEFYPHISEQVVLFPLLYKELTYAELEVMKPLVNSSFLIKNDTMHSYFERIDTDDLMTK